MPPMPSTSLPHRLRAEWATRWGPQQLQLPDGRSTTAAEWLTTARTTTGPLQDVLLDGLLQAASGGEQAAERLLLMLLIPPVDRAAPAGLMSGQERRDRPGIVAAAVWETIRCRPSDAPARHVYRGLVRDATTHLTRQVPAEQRRLDRVTETVDPVLLVDLAGAAPTPTEPAEVHLARLLDRAVQGGIATCDEIALLCRALLGDRTVTDVAAEIDVAPATLRRRLQRLTRRLGDQLEAPE